MRRLVKKTKNKNGEITDDADLNSFGYETIIPDSKNTFTIKLAGNGGFVTIF